MMSGNNPGSGLASFFGGMFGDSGAPFGDAMKQFRKYYDQSRQTQNPFYNAGMGGMENFQKWLGGMQDPGGFINKLMGGYQESPWAKNLQNQSMRAGTNAASANGTAGSTPFAMQMQQNANNISSEDQQKWLQNALGINSQYGAGQQSLMSGGQHAGDIMSMLAQAMGGQMGSGAFGQKFGEGQNFWNMINGGLHFFGM